MMPRLNEGGCSTLGLRVRPMASDHWPTSISFFGITAGTGSPFRSTFTNEIMRDWSFATTFATMRPLPGIVTKMSVGLLMKLKELVAI